MRSSSRCTKSNSSTARASRIRLSSRRDVSRHGRPAGGQFDEAVGGAEVCQGASVLPLDPGGVVLADVESLRHVAGEMVAADRQADGRQQGIAVVHRDVGGVRPDVGHHVAIAAVFGPQRGVGCGQRLEYGLFHHQVGLVGGADQRLVLLLRAGDQMHVHLDPGADHAARIAVAGAAVDGEILREQVQEHLVFLKLDAGGALHHAVQVVLADLAGEADLVTAAAVRPAHAVAPYAEHRRSDSRLGALLGLPDGA